MWALGKLDLSASEQSEGRSGAESRPSRTRNVAGELVEAVPLRREGSGAWGRMVVWPRNGRSDVFRNRSGAVGVILSVCQSAETFCLSPRCLENCVCACGRCEWKGLTSDPWWTLVCGCFTLVVPCLLNPSFADSWAGHTGALAHWRTGALAGTSRCRAVPIRQPDSPTDCASPVSRSRSPILPSSHLVLVLALVPRACLAGDRARASHAAETSLTWDRRRGEG